MLLKRVRRLQLPIIYHPVVYYMLNTYLNEFTVISKVKAKVRLTTLLFCHDSLNDVNYKVEV